MVQTFRPTGLCGVGALGTLVLVGCGCLRVPPLNIGVVWSGCCGVGVLVVFEQGIVEGQGRGRVSRSLLLKTVLTAINKFLSTRACVYHNGIFTGTRANGVILVNTGLTRKSFGSTFFCLVPVATFTYNIFYTRKVGGLFGRGGCVR